MIRKRVYEIIEKAKKGDRYSKVLGGFIALLGIGMFALPTGILGAGFVERIQKEKKSGKVKCPECGKTIEINK